MLHPDERLNYNSEKERSGRPEAVRGFLEEGAEVALKARKNG